MNYKRIPSRKLVFWAALFLIAFVVSFDFARDVFSIDHRAQVEKGAGDRKSVQMSGPIASKAIAFAESPPIRSLEHAPTDAELRAARLRTARKENPDVNAANSEGAGLQPVGSGISTRTANTNIDAARDEAMSNSTPAAPQTLPTPSVSFDGLSVQDTVLLGQGFLPPDTTGEIGPNHFVQAVNVAMRVWDREGNPLMEPKSLGAFFSRAGLHCSGGIGGFPVVIYDQLADRWLLSQRCTTQAPSRIMVAVSKTGDPTGEYYLYAFEAPNLKKPDTPIFGVWGDGYYMATAQFEKSGIFFSGIGFYAFDRDKMLAGDPTAGYVYFDSCPTYRDCKVAGALPADADGFIPPPAGAPGVFGLYTADEWSDPQGDGLRLFDLHADFEQPENSSLTERVGSPLPVAAFHARPPFVPQPGVLSSRYLDPRSEGLMHRLAYRNFGNGRESLIVNHSVWTPTQDRIAVRYYQLDRTSPQAPFTIAEQQTFSPDTTSRWTGSAAMNFLGDSVVGYSASSSTVHPSIRYAARLATDAPGTGLAQGEQTIIAGGGSQGSTTRRWGDYSQMSVDPLDDCSFWYTQEYYSESGNNYWKTRIAKFAPRECLASSPRGTISGTVTSCSTGLPLNGVDLSATGGFRRVSNPSGEYSMTASPGVFDLVPRKHGFRALPIKGITVATGGDQVRDFCMAPVAELAAPEPAVATGNGLIEPNECNEINVSVTNSGAVAATNLVGTLISDTPGVVVTRPTSAYPDLDANGGTGSNLTRFRVSTTGSVSCLTNISLRLVLTYAGGGSPSEVRLTKTIGQPKGPNYEFVASDGHAMPTTAVFVPESNRFDSRPTSIPAPFAFSVYGKPVMPGQQINVIQGGVVEIAPANSSWVGSSFGQRLPTLSFESPVAVLFPFWEEIEMRNDTYTGSGIFTEVTGQAPNRRLMIEWRGRNNGTQPQSLALNVDAALFFTENSDDFEFLYSMAGTFGTAQIVGIQAHNFGSHFTQYRTPDGVWPGRKLTASRPAAICSIGSGSCGGATRFDYDGDGKADPSVRRTSNNNWHLLRATAGYTAMQFGEAGDRLAPADYDGDGKTDVAVFRPSNGAWYIYMSQSQTFQTFGWGEDGDLPVPTDRDADGRTDLVVYRESNNTWYTRFANGTFAQTVFGVTGDKPVVGDFDADGIGDIALYRPSNNNWYIIKSSLGFFIQTWGEPGDLPMTGDFDGDGATDQAVFRPATGQWYLSQTTAGFSVRNWGQNADIPVAADYDGDGRTDVAVFRPSNGTWYIVQSTAGILVQQFGETGDVPTQSAFTY